MTDNHSLGVLEILANGSGFLRRAKTSYLPGRNDVYVSRSLIRQFGLRTGDELGGEVGKPNRRGKSPPLVTLSHINSQPCDGKLERPDFSTLTATHPNELLSLECATASDRSVVHITRVIDFLCPFGKGQRALIVAPAKAGKTTVLRAIAQGVATNHPDCLLLILLVDERPEEVYEMEAGGFGEVIASTFDHPADRHIAVASMTLERARRRVEAGQNVVIILDSITRLARAYNTVERGRGRTLSGGLEATALEKPKRFLGSARRIDTKEGGGSLTIVGTALVDTGSRMDQVIFEEFKGTGNSELVLSRELAERRLFPAIDLAASATRREELLLSGDALAASHLFRQRMADAPLHAAVDDLITRMKRSPTNAEMIKTIVDQG
ncbi:MAG TPA: transcription termination factor Rho [Gemmatimonadales bacterium]|nr:transcription termination factor Rho [Gemmatimonadales bacterium]